jgi:Flp pilus assembly pilin Flp
MMFQTVTFAITNVVKNALSNRRGVSATEYTLMVVGIAALVLAGAQALGGDISSALVSIGTYVSTKGAAI